MNQKSLRGALVALLAVAVLPVGASASGSPRHNETVVVDTGFRVRRDGFSFANWSGLSAVTGISAAHMFQLLDEAGLCSGMGRNPSCTLRNGTVVDRDHLNEHLSQGRCEGMTVLAARLFMRRTRLAHMSPSARSTSELTVTESADEIAFWWATQLAPNIQLFAEGRRASGAHELAHEILGRMRNKVMLTVGLYSRGYAHSVLAIRAVYRRDVTRITVYDPNFPGVTRVLTLDHRSDSWTYPRALMPDGRVVTISGKGAGGLDYVPVSMRSNRGGWDLLAPF